MIVLVISSGGDRKVTGEKENSKENEERRAIKVNFDSPVKESPIRHL